MAHLRRNGGFPKSGILFGGSYSKDSSIFVYIGVPLLRETNLWDEGSGFSVQGVTRYSPHLDVYLATCLEDV